MDAQSTDEFEIHFQRHLLVGADIRVPASVLVQTLEGIQRAIHLLAMEQAGISPRERARVPERIAEQYPVLCSPLHSGSVVLPVFIGNPSVSLLAPQEIEAVTHKFHRALRAVADRQADELRRLLPDREIRIRILESVRSAIPKPGSGWTASLVRGGEQTMTFGEHLLPHIRTLLQRAEDEESLQTVTGRLMGIDFGEHKLTLLYPVNGRQLDCFYEESVEELLFENRRDMIQVTGRVILAEDGQLKKIVEVQEITDLDLSPFTLTDVHYGGRTLRFREPLRLEVIYDESSQVLRAERAELGIDAFAFTREGLLAELGEQTAMLWREYAMEKDAALSVPAQQLKARLLDALEERADAH